MALWPIKGRRMEAMPVLLVNKSDHAIVQHFGKAFQGLLGFDPLTFFSAADDDAAEIALLLGHQMKQLPPVVLVHLYPIIPNHISTMLSQEP